METGLLESLRKYRPREGNDPLENFITEAFAWLLKTHPNFSEFFLIDIMEKPNMQLQGIDKQKCKWITQYNFNGVFPDLVCLSNNNIVVFEHKIWSPLHNNQLQNYKNYAKNNFSNSKLVLITATKFQHKQNPDLALCWSDIYNLISRWLEKNSDASFIFKDFLKLLKSEGMGPPAPISHDSIMYYYASTNLKRNIGNLVKYVEHKDWSSLIKKDYKMFIEKKNGLMYSEAWGRMGFNLLSSWRPGIFVGILLDGKDHCTKPINLSKGSDFCLILDFDAGLHESYPSNKNYVEMVRNLSQKVKALNDGWQLYNHLDDNEVHIKNKWHPIHIRKPMLDIFVGSSTVDDQAIIFYETAKKIIKLVTDEKYFWLLRDENNKTLTRHSNQGLA